jgi:hypothetical protein
MADVFENCHQKTGLVGWNWCAGCRLVLSGWYIILECHEYLLAYQGDKAEGGIPISF